MPADPGVDVTMAEVVDDRKVIELIRDGLSAYQISLRLDLKDTDVRSIAKRHKLGKQLMMNEGCTIRQATAEELAAYGADKKSADQKSKPEPKPKLPKPDPNEELRKAYRIVRDDIQSLRQTLDAVEKFLSLRLDNRLR